MSEKRPMITANDMPSAATRWMARKSIPENKGDKVIKKEETNTVNIENPSPGADRSTAFLSANSVQKSANNVKEEKQDKQSTSKRNVA